jgi:MFS family permease
MSEPIIENQSSRGNSFLLAPIRKSRNFRYLWIGQSLSNAGDGIHSVVLPIVVYSITNSTMAMGLIMTLLLTANIVTFPVAGMLADSRSRRTIMIIADLGRFTLMASITLFSLMSHLTIGFLFGYVILYGVMSAMFNTAYSAMRAEVFTPDIRTAANSLTTIGTQAARLGGPSIGGIILSVTSAAIGFGADAITFVISVASLLFVKSESTGLRPRKQRDGALVHNFIVGLQEIRKHTWLWVSIIVFAVTNIAFGGLIEVLVPWFANVYLRLPSYSYGLMLSGFGFGSLLAGVIYGRKQAWRHRGFICYGGGIVAGGAMLCMALIHWLPALIGLMGVAGIGLAANNLVWEISLQELVPTDVYGRVSSVDMLGSYAGLPIGYLTAGALARVIGGVPTMVINGSVLVLLTTAALLIPAIRQFD